MLLPPPLLHTLSLSYPHPPTMLPTHSEYLFGTEFLTAGVRPNFGHQLYVIFTFVFVLAVCTTSF